ncbi:transposase [bacterium]|nr:transposase [bacterium]
MIRNRKSIRLPGYDYAKPGAYFMTVCVKDHAHLFGSIEKTVMRENEFGKIVRKCWNDLPRHYPSVKLDAFVIMPNHIHGIIIIVDDDHGVVGAGLNVDVVGAGLNVDVGAGLNVDVGAGLNVDIGAGLNVDIGAGLNVDVGAGLKPAPTSKTKNNTPKRHGLSEIIRALKTFSARRINEIRKSPGISVWQRNFYEHIIRNESALNQIRKYIEANPANWQLNNENSISDELAHVKTLSAV